MAFQKLVENRQSNPGLHQLRKVEILDLLKRALMALVKEQAEPRIVLVEHLTALVGSLKALGSLPIVLVVVSLKALVSLPIALVELLMALLMALVESLIASEEPLMALVRSQIAWAEVDMEEACLWEAAVADCNRNRCREYRYRNPHPRVLGAEC